MTYLMNMIDLKNKRIRHAKGPFAMVVVYSFTGASILASIIFSLLLFLSIDDNPWMQFLFASLAVIFELGKFFAWYEFGERWARRHITAALSAFTFYSILAAISIGGSIGGINSATNTAQQHLDVQQNKVHAFDLQIVAIEKEINLNNIAAQRYIQLNRIATGVSRIQKENALLRDQQLALSIERDNLPVANQGSVIGLIGSLAGVLNIEPKTAQLGLVIFLSVLLDLFAAFFVGLIGEEIRFTRTLKSQKLERRHEKSISNHYEITVSREEALLQKAVNLLSSGEIRCTKKAVSDKLLLNSEDTDQVFTQLLTHGFISQKANRHFIWQGSVDHAVVDKAA